LFTFLSAALYKLIFALHKDVLFNYFLFIKEDFFFLIGQLSFPRMIRPLDYASVRLSFEEVAMHYSYKVFDCWQSWAQCHKTFYVRKLRIFVISYGACQCKPFQPSLMFVGKAGAYPSEAPFSYSTLG